MNENSTSMSRPVQRPLAIRDLFVLTLIIALALATCRATGWDFLSVIMVALVGSLVVHATVFARAWNRGIGFCAAVASMPLAILCTLVFPPYLVMAVRGIAPPRQFEELDTGYVDGIIYLFIWTAISHGVLYWLHRSYCSRARSDRVDWHSTSCEPSGLSARSSPPQRPPELSP